MSDKELTVFFVRHAQSHGNVGEAQADFHPDDPSLTRTGLSQARDLARRFSPGSLQAIFASTLIRTCQTVQPTAEKLRLPIQVLPELMEVDTAVGGTSLSHIEALAPNALASARTVFAGNVGFSLKGETPAQCVARAKKVMETVVSRCSPGDAVLVASHGAFFGYLLRESLGLSLPEPFAWEVTNCAVTTIRFRKNDVPILLGTNDTGHFSVNSF